MEYGGELQQLSAFYAAIEHDFRIGATHVSLYMALFHLWAISSFQHPLSVTRQEVMPIAKIHGRATYHKCMNDLESYGYIRYIPSYNPVLKSMVYLLKLTPVAALASGDNKDQ